MNPNANIDAVIAQMGKPPPKEVIKFTEKEVDTGNTDISLRVKARIHTLLSRKELTQLDINLLDALLKYEGK